jgi:alpha-tubulin suppressor-like RCC1 family protein
MKKITLLFLLLTSVFVQAQRFDWVSTAGYSGVANSYNGAIAIARDSQGNLYTLDSATGTQQCQNMTANPAGGTSIFLYKFNALGEIVYIKPIGTNFKPLNVVVGENDNVYVLGSLMGTDEIQINGQTIIDTENRNYIFKLNPAGDLLWRAKNNVSFNDFTVASMLLFSNNHIYFQTSGLSISKLNTSGEYVSTLTATNFSSTTSATGVFFRGGGVLSNGDLVFSATSKGTITYLETVLVPTYNSFLHIAMLTIRTTENLGFVWATYTNGLRDPDLNTIPMAVGNDDGIYLGLQISGTVTAGSDTINSENVSGITGGILKLDANGNKIWLKSTTINVQTWSVLNNPDRSGVLCGGQIFGFQPVTLGTTSVNPLNGNSFISKIDYTGSFQNSFSFGSGPIGSYARCMTTNNLGDFYVSGRLNNGSTVPVFSCVSRTPNNGLYIGKFTEEPDTAPQPFISINSNILTASPTFSGNIQWFLSNVPIVGATNQNLTATESGNYTVSYSYVPACSTISAVKSFEPFVSLCWQTISAGQLQTLAIKSNGTLWGWGENENGQLGNGTNLNSPMPTQIGTNANWLKVSTRIDHTLAIKTDGTLWAWGGNLYGQLGNNSNENTNIPVQIGTDTDWQDIAAGSLHSTALKTNGTIWTWGANMFVQLGDGTSTNRNFSAQVGSSNNWSSISSNFTHTLALKSNGTLWAWGFNNAGQYGNGTINSSSNPVQIGNATDWLGVSTGGEFSVGVKNNGTLWSWGDNIVGQLGIGLTSDQLSPIQVGTATDWKNISAGQMFVAALKTNNSLWGWGLNSDGQLGNGTETNAPTPIQIGTATDWNFVDAGLSHTSALKNDGSLSAWGANSAGGLGDGTTIGKNTPTAINCSGVLLTQTTKTIAAGGNFSLFVCGNGTVTSTGINTIGQLGSGNNISTLLPVAVSGLTDVVAVAARDVFSLFLKSDGTVWGTGFNAYGQLGNGTTTSTNIPIQIPSLTGIVKIAAGFYHSLFLKNDGTVWACGRNFSGEVGNGNQIQQNTPVLVSSLSNIVDIAAGDYHSIFLAADGTVKACGDNQDGALGFSGPFSVPLPTTSTITDVVSIGAGFRQSIFIKNDGTVWACGLNYFGKLGFGGTSSQTTPGQVTNLTGIIKATGGQYHTIFLKNDGTVWSCGLNSTGQLGDGTTINRLTPVQVINITNANEIAASGYYHSLISTIDTTFYAFGQGGGQLGIGNTATQITPVLVVDNCVALAVESFESSQLSIYPNPSSGILNFSFDTILEHVSIQIYDTLGRMVFTKVHFKSDKSIDISNLQSGMYIANVTVKGKNFSQKIIKQ